MNAYTTMSAKGQVVIPAEMRERMKLLPGMRLEVTEKGGEIKLKPVKRHNPFPRTTTADLDRLPRWQGPAKSVDEISRLSDEALRKIFAEQEKNARD
jgi:AbrB family looped-hinge helix DNA binding protein